MGWYFIQKEVADFRRTFNTYKNGLHFTQKQIIMRLSTQGRKLYGYSFY